MPWTLKGKCSPCPVPTLSRPGRGRGRSGGQFWLFGSVTVPGFSITASAARFR